MPSSFSWLDTSENERRKALDAIRLFREHDTRDELGLGAIRDVFADLFFPGTSTIQTRARYFLFVPWIYVGVERRFGTRAATVSEMAASARRDEITLITALVEANETEGVIGIEARSALQRLPSAIYWQGLGTWRIRLSAVSQDQYHRILSRLSPIPKRRLVADEEGERLVGPAPTWHPYLPPPPPEFPRQADFLLSASEAVWLRERIISACPETLLAWLVDRGKRWEDVNSPWEHPQFGSFQPRMKELLVHARDFSEAMHGAALLYNLMLAERRENLGLQQSYVAAMDDWAERIGARSRDFSAWDRRQFWSLVDDASGSPITPRTKKFVNEWLDLSIGSLDKIRLSGWRDARLLVEQREWQLKGARARLRNPRALELWNGAAGTRQIDYRWRQTQRIVKDILAGDEKGS